MREIGSEFWQVPATEDTNGVFPGNTVWFLSGRSALAAILKELPECRTAALPSWCCDSMVKPFADAGMEVRFYPVCFDGGLRQEPRGDCDILFLMDYFGYGRTVEKPADFAGAVIRDVTHSLFSGIPEDADYLFGSLRKWCGVWTGGYGWTRDGHPLRTEEGDDGGYAGLRQSAMEQKEQYLGAGGGKDYLAVFEEAEACLEAAGALPAAERDADAAVHLDAAFVKEARRANAKILMEAFPDWLIFPQLGEGDCPMFVPVLVPGGRRDALRKHLIEQEIYCPVHWPVSEYHRLTERERELYDNGLSLVCDQRYTAEDMHRIVDAVNGFLKGGA